MLIRACNSSCYSIILSFLRILHARSLYITRWCSRDSNFETVQRSASSEILGGFRGQLAFRRILIGHVKVRRSTLNELIQTSACDQIIDHDSRQRIDSRQRNMLRQHPQYQHSTRLVAKTVPGCPSQQWRYSHVGWALRGLAEKGGVHAMPTGRNCP